MKNGNASPFIQRPNSAVVASDSWPNHNHQHIRPLAVSPLNYPERVPTPWGFFVPDIRIEQTLATIETASRKERDQALLQAPEEED